MKTIFTLIAFFSIVFTSSAQTEFQRELINEINSVTAEINSDPQNPDLYVQRSKAIFKLNAIEPGQKWVPFTLLDAITDINSALAINDKDPKLYSYRAEYKRDIHGDYNGAIADMDIAVQLDPENSNWYFQRAAYKHFTAGCLDYEQCSVLKDARCAKIMQAVCQ